MKLSRPLRLLPILWFCYLWPGYAAEQTAEEVQMLTLDNEHILVRATPEFGGRVLWFGLRGRDNILLVGEAVEDPARPPVNAEAGHVPYLGHTVWAGPQSEWWLHQSVNLARKAENAPWPPDPYLVLAENKLLEQSPGHLLMEGVASPVSGLQLRKSFSLVEGRTNALDLGVEAVNTRDQPVAWDIWFNTRVHPSTRVYVPVAEASDLRVLQLADEEYGPLDYEIQDGLFSLNLTDPPAGRAGRKGKAFIQPCAGWMAGFTEDQLFIIRFPLVPREEIHHEQGQIEIYLEWLRESPAAGVQEMELHAPYRELAPGESMSASERWYLFPYDGPATRAAHSEYLREIIKRTGSDPAGC